MKTLKINLSDFEAVYYFLQEACKVEGDVLLFFESEALNGKSLLSLVSLMNNEIEVSCCDKKFLNKIKKYIV